MFDSLVFWIPISAPNVCLLASRLQKRSFAIRMHYAAAGQNALLHVDRHFDVMLKSAEHFFNLLFCRFILDQ